MKWNRPTVVRLAEIIRERSLCIQDEEIAAARRNSGDLMRVLARTDERIMALLEPLGFERAT